MEKVNPKSRAALRQLYTRSQSTPPLSLHNPKGQVKFWHLPNWYIIISYEHYLRDYVNLSLHCQEVTANIVQGYFKDRKDLDKQPVEPMDFSHEDPRYPHKSPYQCEVCRKGRAKILAKKNEVHLPFPYKGNR